MVVIPMVAVVACGNTSTSTSISTTDPVTSVSPDVLWKRQIILDTIRSLILVSKIDISNTLPSEITNENLTDFFDTPPPIKGVTFNISIDGETIAHSQDKYGSFTLKVTGEYQGATLNALKFIKGFKKSK